MEKKMMILAAVAFLLFSSCQTKPVVWDDSYPEEKLASVQFFNMKVDSYNGIGVEKFNWVKIPAGETAIGADVVISHGGVQFHARGMEFTYVFEGGRNYTVNGSVNEMRWGVSVYSNKEFIAFIPFKNQPKFT